MKKANTKMIIKIIGIILILIWMITVFIFSNEKETESKVTSRKVTVAIVQAISGQDISDDEELLKDVDKVVRKLAHYTLYTIGGMLIISFIYTLEKSKKEKILYSIAFGICFVITDEVHQLFVPGRTGRLLDVGIDTLGIITGVLIFLIIKEMIGAVKTKIQEQK